MLSSMGEALRAERDERLRLKSTLAEIRWLVALRRFARKYRDDQPRDELGRWVYDGGRKPRGSTGPNVAVVDGVDALGAGITSDANPDSLLPRSQYAQT